MDSRKATPRATDAHGEELFKHGAKIGDLLSADMIKVRMEARDKEEAFEELVDILVQTKAVTHRDAALAALYRREEMASTGIGNGVAIPHGKDESVQRLVAALGVSQRGIDFAAKDGKPAHVIFMLLARSNNPGPHIQALASIAEMIQEPTFIRQLMEAENASSVIEIIRSEEQTWMAP